KKGASVDQGEGGGNGGGGRRPRKGPAPAPPPSPTPPPQCPRNARRRSEHAFPPPRRGKRALQGAWPQWHLHYHDRWRVRCLPESSHLLLPHQRGVVRRGRMSRHTPRRRTRGKSGGSRAYAEGLYESGGR